MILLVGDVEPQASAVRSVLDCVQGYPEDALDLNPDLIIVAGYRRLVPPSITSRYRVVGFHSAKLPEYPGRAPIYWTLLRGDEYVWNTMLFLDGGIDSGDSIDADFRRVRPSDTPETLYEWIAESDARMLRRHLPALLAGKAPRQPQDMAHRGPLTGKEGYEIWRTSQSS